MSQSTNDDCCNDEENQENSEGEQLNNIGVTTVVTLSRLSNGHAGNVSIK